MDEEPKIFRFRSDSNPAITHETRQHANGAVDCSCRGWQNHSKCWHVDKVKSGQATNFEYLGTLPLLKRVDVRAAVDQGNFETAVEIVFEVYPTLTRDEAVDLVQTIAADYEEGREWP